MGFARRRSRRRIILVGVLVLVALVVATNAASRRNQDLDANHEFGRIYKGDAQKDCWRHHRSDAVPMVDSHVVIPLFPKQVKLNEPADLRLQIENPWLAEITAYRVELNLTKAPGLRALVGEAAEPEPPFAVEATGRLLNNLVNQTLPKGTEPAPSWTNVTVNLTGDPIRFLVQLDLTFGPNDLPPDTALPDEVTVTVYPPGGSASAMLPRDDTATHRTLRVPKGESAAFDYPTPGQYRFQIGFVSGAAEYVDWRLNATAEHRRPSQATVEVLHLARDPQELESTPNRVYVGPGQVLDVPSIPVVGVAPGPQEIEVLVEANLYYRHGGGKGTDEDYYHRYAVVIVNVGDTFIPGDDLGATSRAIPMDFGFAMAEITGFASAALLVPSLLLGGTYGKASRQFFNAVLGGAKRRVMFHNLVSLGLTALAIVHILLFLAELRYTVLMGLLYGGLSALCLLVLGLTGFYQVPLIQRHGYEWWHTVHLVTGILLVLFVAMHAVADGADFASLRAQLPEWVARFNIATG